MRICVVAVVFVLAMFMLVSTYAAHGSAGSSSVDSQQECKAWYQHVLKGHQMEVGFQEDDDDELRLKVCGAWPGCTSCVEMSEGDCRYVFPTNVMVYSENQQGIDKICACQVLGCQLPWDPGKWGRKCAVPLGCYSKESRIRETEFPSSLCGSKKGNKRIKFGPLAFTHQTYSQPGVAIIMYEGDKIVDRKYMLHPQVMGYGKDDAIGKDLHKAANAVSMPVTLSLFNPSQDYEKHVEQLQVGDNGYKLQMYRRDDTVCIRDYGLGDRNRKIAPVVERCFPIPGAPIPVLYARAGTEANVVSLSEYVRKKALFPARGKGYAEVLENAKKTTLLQGLRVECSGGFHGGERLKRHNPTVVGAVEDHEYSKERETECLLSKSTYKGKIEMRSSDTQIIRGRISSMPLRRKLEANNWKAEHLPICTGLLAIFPDFTTSCLTRTEKQQVASARSAYDVSEYAKKQGGIYRFGGYAIGDAKSFCDNVGYEVVGQTITNGTFYGNSEALCRFAVAHMITKDAYVNATRRGCEYMSAVKTANSNNEEIAAKSVLCPSGILNIDDQEYEVLNTAYCKPEEYCEFSIGGLNRNHGTLHNGSSGVIQSPEGLPMMKYVRIRVKKKPKSLRRYAVVNSNGTRKRIRCDDRYSIDMYTVSQEVLNNSKVIGNRFEFPREYLGQSVSDDSKDPCHSARSKIVYYYEHGGFIAGEEALKECGNPVEEYYAPNKKVVGCEYDYVRTDNYKPFLQGLKSADIPSAVPLSKYEQGICVDNFEKTWFLPTYLTHRDVRGIRFVNKVQESCCVWDSLGTVEQQGVGVHVLMRDGNTRSRHEYAYNVSKRNGSDGTYCTLYKIEMWGGGEYATYDSSGFNKRSGRPGQYVMLALDLSKLPSNGSREESRRTHDASNTGTQCSNTSTLGSDIAGQCVAEDVEKVSSHFLVMKIGKGGSSRTGGKGGDTVLRLCKGSAVARSEGSRVSAWKYSGGSKRFVQWKVCGKESSECRTKRIELLQDNCYEIAKAVGGGSERVVAPSYAMAQNIMVYYRTIYGDVLAHDDAAIGLLESHNAMFTKFSLEMNLKEENDEKPYDPILRIVNDRRYFEGRSLPRQFCRWKKYRKTERDNKYALIPGMGGCWKSAANVISEGVEDEQGVGEDGAVMITCERWEKA